MQFSLLCVGGNLCMAPYIVIRQKVIHLRNLL
jgi:hypothetical protein